MARKTFSRIDSGIARIVCWGGAYTLLSGGFSWLGKQLETLGPLGWPEAIFLGLGAASLILLVLSFGLVSWRYFRPLPLSGGISTKDAEAYNSSSMATEMRKDAPIRFVPYDQPKISSAYICHSICVVNNSSEAVANVEVYLDQIEGIGIADLPIPLNV